MRIGPGDEPGLFIKESQMTLKELLTHGDRLGSLMGIAPILEHKDDPSRYIKIYPRSGLMFEYRNSDETQRENGILITARYLESFLKKLKKVEDLDSEDWRIWDLRTECFVRKEINSILDTLLTSVPCVCH